MPGSERSSVYLPAPVVFPAASTIGMGLPMMENLVMDCRRCLLLRLNRCFDRLVHLAVASAAAEITAQRFANFIVGWIEIGRQQMFDRHHESRSAEAALCAAPIAIGLLNCGQRAVLGDAFDSRDL